VRIASFSPDGTTLALGNSPGTSSVIRIMDVATGKDLSGGGGHRGTITGLAISADGKSVTTRSLDNTVRQWDAATGKELSRLTFPTATLTYYAALSPDGRLVAVQPTGAAAKIEIWDVSAAKVVQTLDVGAGRATTLLFTPDNKTLAVRSADAVVRLYDVASGKEQGQIAEPNLTGNAADQGLQYGAIFGHGMVFSPDGGTLATAWYVVNRTNNNQRHSLIHLWQVGTGRKIGRVETRQGSHIAAMACSPDGRTLATSSYPAGTPRLADDLTISLWETATGRERCRLKAGNVAANVAALAFSPDGRTLAFTGNDRVIHLWDVRAGKELSQLSGHQGLAASLAFAADGKRLHSGSTDTTALVWDVASLATAAGRCAGRETARDPLD
jgi:Tol biopolymer transport system component